jgi:hypothetical protein
MKRLFLGVTIFGGAALLGGCPIYPDQARTYQCPGECCSDADCGPGSFCSQDGLCTASVDASTSSSGLCGPCPIGTLCTLAGGTPQCLPPGSVPEDAGVEPADVSVVPPGPTVDAGVVVPPGTDASGGSLESGTTGVLCNADSQCTGAVGSKCIDGLCTAQGQLCSDGTQCLVAGESCVDGICLPTCSAGGTPCPAGYECDYNRHVCAVNPGSCATTSDCQGGAVCVETRCVAPCASASAEAGSQCPAGQVCVNGGCIPDQGARFTCQNDGNVGNLASTCDPGSICLHGDCYPMCDADGGGCTTAGQACKSVTIPKGTFFVCGTATTLGSECNPAVGKYCAPTPAACVGCTPIPRLCIDGYCL